MTNEIPTRRSRRQAQAAASDRAAAEAAGQASPIVPAAAPRRAGVPAQNPAPVGTSAHTASAAAVPSPPRISSFDDLLPSPAPATTATALQERAEPQDVNPARAVASPGRPAQPSKPRPKVTVTGVLGELLITVGVVVLLYVAWQMWIGDWIQGMQASAEGAKQSQTWADDAAKQGDLPLSDPDSPYNTLTADPPKIEVPQTGVDFAQLRVPRFGETYSFPMAGGIKSYESLNHGRVGYYPDTALPGQPGNFAVAGHRGSYGAPFEHVPALQVGDAIVVETKDGWYTYRFRNLEYVQPSQTDVLLPTPQQPDLGVSGSYITLTTCAPRYGWDERIAAFGTFESFTPRSADGKLPASLTMPEGS